MVRHNVLRSTMLLTASGVIAKTIDFLFRAYYSQKLGSEGMGIFSLVFSVHSIMLTVATGGLGVAVSKIVSEQYISRSFVGIKKTMQIALTAVISLSLPVIGCAAAFSNEIAQHLLKEPRCALSIVFLSPSILFMGISYCIKGYFYASRKVIRPASSEFLEQAVKIVSIRFLLSKWLPNGIEHGCEAVFLGLSIGEFSSCFYLSVLYAADSRRLCGGSLSKGLISAIVRVALPVMTSSLASSFLRMQEDVWIVAGLKSYGLEHSAALSSYGSLHGMIMPLLTFPLTLLSSCFTMLVPEISRADSMTSRIRIQTLVSRIYRFTAFLGFLIMCIYTAFSPELALFVYDAPQLAPQLRTLALLSPIMFMDSVSCGILNGLGKQPSMLGYSLMDSALRLSLIFTLIPRFGINSLILIIILSNIFTFMLTGTRARKSAGISFETVSCFIKPLISAFVTAFIVHNIFNHIVGSVTIFSLVPGIIGTVAVYSCVSCVLGSLSRNDISWLLRRMILNT